MEGLQLKKNNSFLFTCKENYFLGIHPSDMKSRETEGYKRVVQIARTYFEADLYDLLAAYFVESRYLIQLWAAHMILEHGEPDVTLKERCLDVIKDYILKCPTAELAEHEKHWLKNHLRVNVSI